MRCKLNIHNEIDCTGYSAALQDFFGAAIVLSWFTFYNLGETLNYSTSAICTALRAAPLSS